MFYSLTGNIIYKDENSVALSCGGVAFRCFSTYNTLRKVTEKDGEVTLFTHLNVREDSLDLYGFYNTDELDVFKLLIGVSGIGPKAALSILSEFTPDSLAVSVASGDSKSLTKAQGIGAKLAQRIVLELKDKIGSYRSGDETANLSDISAISKMSNTQSAVSALVELGYSQTEAALAVSRLDPSLSDEELIKAALKSFISFL